MGKIILAGSRSELRTQISLLMALRQAEADKPLQGGSCDDKTYAPKRQMKPIIKLYFEEQKTVGNVKRLKTGVVSMRVMNKSHTTLTTTDINLWSERIKSKFATPPFVWQKGKKLYSYAIWDLGYQFQLLCQTMDEAKRLIDPLLEIQGHSPDWKFLNQVTNAEEASRYRDIAEKETILGVRRELPIQRPVVKVKYRYATLTVFGLPDVIILNDLTGRLKTSFDINSAVSTS